MSSAVRALVKDCLGVVSNVNTETSAIVLPRQPLLCKQQSTACGSQVVSSNGGWSHTAPVWDTTTNVSKVLSAVVSGNVKTPQLSCN